MILRKMQEIRHEAKELKTLSRMESTVRTADELATLSRRASIRQLGRELGDLYGCLEASSRLNIGWLAEVLQADIPPLIDTLNAQGEALGFRVNRSGDWLSLDVIDNG